MSETGTVVERMAAAMLKAQNEAPDGTLFSKLFPIMACAGIEALLAEVEQQVTEGNFTQAQWATLTWFLSDALEEAKAPPTPTGDP